MFFHVVDRLAQAREDRGRKPRGLLLHRSFYWHGVPRLMLWCRMFGHRPVVDGIGPSKYNPEHRYQNWVVCGRCGVRAEPQGSLNPEVFPLGAPYRGDHQPWQDPEVVKASRPGVVPETRLPGPIDPHPTGEIGGELVIGRMIPGFRVEFKVGNGGSEHTLSGSIRFGNLGALYLHTSRFGTGLQRRFNPVGYTSRVFGFQVGDGRIEWQLWAARDGSSRAPLTDLVRWARPWMPARWRAKVREFRPRRPEDDPWWRHGEISTRLRDNVLGPNLYEYTPMLDEPVARVVRMPEGDYLVTLMLQRVSRGRKRGRKRAAERPWSVEWNTAARGIPTDRRRDRGGIYGSAVSVSERSVRAGTWPAEAAAAIALQMTEMRSDNNYEPAVPVHVDMGKVKV